MRYNASLTNFNDGASRAHLARYFVARGFILSSDFVIDAACGTGYGSELLANIAKQIYAFDQLDKIKETDFNNIEYKKIDLESVYEYPKADVVISLETIEHLSPEGAKNFIDCVLKKTRKFFIFSVPLFEKLGANPFHKQVFPTKDHIWNLVQREGWKPFHSYMQGNHLIGIMWRDNENN